MKSGKRKAKLHEALPWKLSQESGAKFGLSEAELPFLMKIGMKFGRIYDLPSTRSELFELATKEFCGRFRKFDRVHDHPISREAELHLELTTKEASTEG
ncbi:hypothetical protein COCNU_16G002000 [Cocos nucifera]|uniref:Uncharacterized protein n=1 Tax=Cocos nucifera TaxID=13894 RepID=A0A8K0NDV2_COCNU|nr:hypothetical protein COCNU_16G002000 [Cocos nucifera]